MYVATKGGETAIAAAHAYLARARRGALQTPEIGVDQISGQLTLATDRIMAEGSLYDPELAALALKQARGDAVEAVFLLRAYRTTLPRFGYAEPLETASMRVIRRISATYKDMPGGQILGPTFDYTHRLLDFSLAADAAAEGSAPAPSAPPAALETRADPAELSAAELALEQAWETPPHILGLLDQEGLMEPASREGDINAAGDDAPPPDLTRAPLEFPATRALRLQALARGDEGFLLSLAYSTQRGFGRTHAFVGELRIGAVAVSMEIPELGFAIDVGEIRVTECETVNQFTGSKTEPAQFTRGYGLVFGQGERKALAMSLVERALRWRELGEDSQDAPAQDEEFVLSHADNIQASGFLEHIKLPHYVDFQAELEQVRGLRADAASAALAADGEAGQARGRAPADDALTGDALKGDAP